MGPPERRCDSGGEFSGVRLAGLILARLGKIGFQRLQLRQLGVEFALQRERLAEALFVAGVSLGGVAGPAFLLLQVRLEMLQDVFEPGDQSGLVSGRLRSGFPGRSPSGAAPGSLRVSRK